MILSESGYRTFGKVIAFDYTGSRRHKSNGVNMSKLKLSFTISMVKF